MIVNDLGGDREGGGKGDDTADTVSDIKAAGGEAVANYDSVATREGADSMLWSRALQIWPGRHPGQQRRYFARQVVSQHERCRLGHRYGRPSERHLLLLAGGRRQLKVQGKGGRIINTTSLSGMMGNFGQANYSAAKAGIYGLTRTLSIELREGHGQRDRAHCVDANDRGPQDVQAIPNAKEMLAPDHISPVALFLASDLAADINGTIVGVWGQRFRSTR